MFCCAAKKLKTQRSVGLDSCAAAAAELSNVNFRVSLHSGTDHVCQVLWESDKYCRSNDSKKFDVTTQTYSYYKLC